MSGPADIGSQVRAVGVASCCCSGSGSGSGSDGLSGCSDSTLLTADSLLVLKRLQKLLHLSLSRCYHIHLAALW